MSMSDGWTKPKGVVYDALLCAAETIPGWTPPEQLLALYAAALFSPHTAGDIVEVGSWCGRSTVALGLAAKELGCRMHAVDIFPERDDWFQNGDGTWSIRTLIDGVPVLACVTQTVWNEAFVATVLPVYADGASPRLRLEDALTRFGLHDTVVVHRMTGAGLRKSLPDLRMRLLFLDGDHDEATVREDIEGFLPFFSPGGLFCLDDAFTVYEGIDRAITARLIQRVPPVMAHGGKITGKMYVARLAG